VKVRSPIAQVLENVIDAAWRRTAMLNRKMVDIAYSNLNFGFELARAKTFSDVLKLQADYWQKLFNAFQGEEFRNGLFETGTPRSLVIQDESAKEERDHPHTKRKNASNLVVGTATEKPKQRFEPSSKRRAAARAPEGKRKAEKSRSKLKDHRLPSSEAHTGAREDPVSQSRRAEIQFGRLDDNAVRFTSLEAWRLLYGTWRPISVDEVLSDAVVLSKARFDQLFPQVPQLPTDAFLPDHDQE
jgi:hypothetical protein